MRWLLLSAVLLAACGTGSAPSDAPRAPERPDVLLATTTSFQDSGLLDHLVEDFRVRTGYRIRATAVGSGAAIAIGASGDADVVFAHSPKAELEFMDRGNGDRRVKVMYNEFVILGPPNDPAKARGLRSLRALHAIADSRATFYSRGDRSGTDIFEKDLWRQAGITPGPPWYLEAATGMGQTLQVADEKSAYTISDRGTYLARKKDLALVVVSEKDPPLLNHYHVMTVNAARHPRVNRAGADAFVDYLVSKETQQRIAAFGIDRYGEPLFHADAN